MLIFQDLTHSLLKWLTEVTGTKIGRWPVAEVAVKMSESPAYIGGRLDRGAPCYGEDNNYVYGELLGMSSREIEALAEEGVIWTTLADRKFNGLLAPPPRPPSQHPPPAATPCLRRSHARCMPVRTRQPPQGSNIGRWIPLWRQ